MRKRVMSVFWIIMLVSTLFVQAMAIEPYAVSYQPSLEFDGTTAVCSAGCMGDSMKDDLHATLTLYQGRNYIDSWSESDTGILSFEGKYRAVSGKSYKLTLEYSVNGKKMPSVSVTGVCP